MASIKPFELKSKALLANSSITNILLATKLLALLLLLLQTMVVYDNCFGPHRLLQRVLARRSGPAHKQPLNVKK